MAENETQNLIPKLIGIGGAIFLLTIGLLYLLGILGPESELTFTREEIIAVDVPLDEVVQYGQRRWTEMRAQGIDLAAGPCLDDGVTYEGWAIDLVRTPRQRIDNLPENQCASYESGRAVKLVELSLSGNLIRVLPDDAIGSVQ